MPRVVNKHWGNNPGARYCGRGSKYGNPFRIAPGCTRDQACDRYVPYAVAKFTCEEVEADLRGRDLECFCAPARCHCDFLLNWANRGLPWALSEEALR